MNKSFFVLTTVCFIGCIGSNDDISTYTSNDTFATDTDVTDATSRAPECDKVNENTVFYDEPSNTYLGCSKGAWHAVDMEEKLTVSSYYWTPYNAYDLSVYVTCGTLSGGVVGVITGVQSQHSNHHEDRRFSYKCSFIY